MFKIGEKVVYVGTRFTNDSRQNQPQENEIVTILSKCSCYANAWDVLEYQFNKDNIPQSFTTRSFRKLDHTFAEEVTARIEEEINQENLILTQ